jgi:phospholipase/lecithinase/hemolysin
MPCRNQGNASRHGDCKPSRCQRDPWRLRLATGLAVLLASSWARPAEAALSSLTNLFVFGDSLSDSGNTGLRSKQVTGTISFQPTPPYYNGQFSNGPVAVQYLWDLYNPGDTSFQPSLAGGTNYAIGGATTGVSSNLAVTPQLGGLAAAYDKLGNAWQLRTFAQQAPPFDPRSSLFVVWLFPSDLIYWDQTGGGPASNGLSPGTITDTENPASTITTDQLVGNGIGNILGTVGALYQAGARNFLVPNMPDLGKTPLYADDPGTAAALSALSVGFNTVLKAQIDGLVLPGADLDQFDTFSYVNELVAGKGSLVLDNVTDSCLAIDLVGGNPPVQNPDCDPDEYLFWDLTHPTTVVHKDIASRFYSLTAAPVPAPLPAAGALAAMGWSRRLRRRLRERDLMKA